MNRFVYLALFLIIILAAFLRLWDLRKIPPGLYHDEAMNVNQAREAWREGDFKIFYSENNGREGLFINIQALSLAAFGYTPFAVRLPSALFGILTVLGIFFLTRELFAQQELITQNVKNERVALFATFFLATSFWHINFSRIGFRAIMAPFFLVWSMYFLWKMINKNFPNQNSMLRATCYTIIGGLLFGLGFHSYIAYRVAPLLLIVPFFIGWKIYKLNAKRSTLNACLPCLLALFLFFAFIVAYPLGVYFLENPADFSGRSAQVSIFSSEMPLGDLLKNIGVTISMFFWHGDYNWRHNLSGSPQLWWPVSLLFLIGFIISIRVLIQNAKIKNKNDNAKLKNFKLFGVVFNFALCVLSSPYGFLLVWFSAFLLPVVLSNEGLPHALRALPLVIPAIIFAAIGLEWIVSTILRLLQKKRDGFPDAVPQLNRLQRELALLLFVFFVAIAAHSFNQYFLRWSWNPHVYAAFNGSYAELSRYLVALPNGTKKYIIVNTPNHMLADDIPMPAQTVMFFTDTWNKQERDRKNFVYIPSANDLSLLPQTLSSPTVIVMLENDPLLRRELKIRYPELASKITEEGLTQFLIFIKS